MRSEYPYYLLKAMTAAVRQYQCCQSWHASSSIHRIRPTAQLVMSAGVTIHAKQFIKLMQVFQYVNDQQCHVFLSSSVSLNKNINYT